MQILYKTKGLILFALIFNLVLFFCFMFLTLIESSLDLLKNTLTSLFPAQFIISANSGPLPQDLVLKENTNSPQALGEISSLLKILSTSFPNLKTQQLCLNKVKIKSSLRDNKLLGDGLAFCFLADSSLKLQATYSFEHNNSINLKTSFCYCWPSSNFFLPPPSTEFCLDNPSAKDNLNLTPLFLTDYFAASSFTPYLSVFWLDRLAYFRIRWQNLKDFSVYTPQETDKAKSHISFETQIAQTNLKEPLSFSYLFSLPAKPQHTIQNLQAPDYLLLKASDNDVISLEQIQKTISDHQLSYKVSPWKTASLLEFYPAYVYQYLFFCILLVTALSLLANLFFKPKLNEKLKIKLKSPNLFNRPFFLILKNNFLLSFIFYLFFLLEVFISLLALVNLTEFKIQLSTFLNIPLSQILPGEIAFGFLFLSFVVFNLLSLFLPLKKLNMLSSLD